MRAIWAAGGKEARYSRGDMPYVRRKLVVKEPTLCRPTAKQIDATERSVVRRRAAARSSRRVRRYTWGDSPNARLNSRLKCARESPAVRARSSTPSGSAYRASARSLARSKCRVVGATFIPLRRPYVREVIDAA